jgi:hypothetical protein
MGYTFDRHQSLPCACKASKMNAAKELANNAKPRLVIVAHADLMKSNAKNAAARIAKTSATTNI